jgi:CrcB protein
MRFREKTVSTYPFPRRIADPGILRRVVDMRSYLPVLAVSLGGILGANARYLVSVYVAERLGTAFPYGTFLINISGSLVIGFFLTLATERLSVDPLWRLFLATGFLGAYTTFSSYTFEAAHLIRDGAYGLALLYLFGSVLAGMIGVFAGIVAAERL